jgi:hypothetical protein
MGMIFCLAVVVGIGYFIFHLYVNRNEPPKLNSFAPVPVQIGDKVVLLGVGVVEWQVPPELDALYLKMEKLKKEEAEKAAKEAAAKAGKKSANSPADAAKTNTSPQTTNELK